MGDLRELTIESVGAQGDGRADCDGRPVFVPFTLAGERVRADVSGERGRLIEILDPSSERVAPVCRHFGRCGGCAVQHMPAAMYRDWKGSLVPAALRSRGLEAEVSPLAEPGGLRRRAVFSVERTGGGMAVGFNEAQSHVLVAIEECPVLDQRIVAALPSLRELLGLVAPPRTRARMTVTLTDAGFDVLIEDTERRLSPALRTELAAMSERLHLARLMISDETVFEALRPELSFGNVAVVLPPGSFVQPVREAEADMARRIVSAVGRAKSVADLFCGAGAFTFPLAAKARVAAFDGDAAAIAALETGARHASGLKPVTAKVRDLFREPLSPLELNEHEAIVFDPPRAGAEAQSRSIARSKVKTVVAVSCSPATLARDLHFLVTGGYKIESLTPIDQFRYSPHVEAVAVLRR